MDGYLRQSTASQTRTIGPFINDTDFVTPENGLTIANTDIRLKKNGAADVAKNSGGGTADVNGLYAVTWDATDTDTVGQLHWSVFVSGALLAWGTYTVLEEAVYDALFAASALGYVANAPVNVAQWNGSNVAAPSTVGVPLVDVARWLNVVPLALSSQQVQAVVPSSTVVASVTGDIGGLAANAQSDVRDAVGLASADLDTQLGDIATDAALAAAAAASADSRASNIQSRLPAALVSGRIAAVAEVVDDKTGYALSAAAIDSLWDEIMEGAITARQSLRLANSANASKTSGGGTANFTIRDVADTKNRIVATVDADGNRSAITLDVT